MLQLIALIIFIVSLAELIFILWKKIPVLVQLPQNGHHGFKKSESIANIEKKIKDTYFHLFSKQMLLHKVLSFVKITTLKLETKIDELLHGIRKRAQELDKKVKNKK